MGIDPMRLCNHNLYYTTAMELKDKVAQTTGLPVFQVVVEDGEWVEPSDGFNGWRAIINGTEDLIKEFEPGTCMELYRYPDDEETNIELTFNPYVLEYYSESSYPGRWFEIHHLMKLIIAHGLPHNDAYDMHPAKHYLNQRVNYYNEVKPFGASAAIIFCYDHHQECLNYFYEQQWRFEQFVAWGKEQLVFVRFQDLPNIVLQDIDFDKHYLDLFIYDDFSDLR